MRQRYLSLTHQQQKTLGNLRYPHTNIIQVPLIVKARLFYDGPQACFVHALQTSAPADLVPIAHPAFVSQNYTSCLRSKSMTTHTHTPKPVASHPLSRASHATVFAPHSHHMRTHHTLELN